MEEANVEGDAQEPNGTMGDAQIEGDGKDAGATQPDGQDSAEFLNDSFSKLDDFRRIEHEKMELEENVKILRSQAEEADQKRIQAEDKLETITKQLYADMEKLAKEVETLKTENTELKNKCKQQDVGDAQTQGDGKDAGAAQPDSQDAEFLNNSFSKLFDAINLVNTEVIRRGGEGVPELKQQVDKKAWREAQAAIKSSIPQKEGGKGKSASSSKEVRALEMQLASEKKANDLKARAAKQKEERLLKEKKVLVSKLDGLRSFVAASGDLWALRTAFRAWHDDQHAVTLERMSAKADQLQNLVTQLRKVRHDRSEEMLQHWQREGPWQVASAVLNVWRAETQAQVRIRLCEDLAAEVENQRLRMQGIIDNLNSELQGKEEDLVNLRNELQTTKETVTQLQQELEDTRNTLAEAETVAAQEKADKEAALQEAGECRAARQAAEAAALAAHKEAEVAKGAKEAAEHAKALVQAELEEKREAFEASMENKNRADRLAEKVRESLVHIEELQRFNSEAANTIEELKMEVDRLTEQGWLSAAEAETSRAEMRVYAALLAKMHYRQEQTVEAFKKDLLFRDVRIEHLQLNIERLDPQLSTSSQNFRTPLPPMVDSPEQTVKKMMDGIPKPRNGVVLHQRRGQQRGLKVLPSIHKAAIRAEHRMLSPRGPHQRLGSPRGQQHSRDSRGVAGKTWHSAWPHPA